MKKHNLYALVAAGLLASGMSVSSASAADLGGNCCADLEERIAELEATTARKGNRKVSLTVSGWVGQQVTFWDDGVESNTYVHDLGSTLGSHVKFTGSAQISPGWSAGYVLQLEAIGSDGLTTDQGTAGVLGNGPDGPGALTGVANSVQTLQSYWFIKSDQLGKVSVGKQSQASDNTAILVDGSGSLVPANWVAYDTNAFAVRGLGAGTMIWGGTQGCFGMGGAWGDCNGLTQNVVRYDSPTFGGFSISASWGEDDMWDVAGRYAGEWAGFKVAAAAAYNEVTDNRYNQGTLASLGGNPDMDYFQAGLFVMHVPTGLFGLVNYGDLDVDAANGAGAYDAQTWYGKIGLRSRLSALGHTVFYGEYLNGQDGAIDLQFLGTTGAYGVAGNGGSSELEVWGGGIVQEVDAAAMSVWVKYRHMSFDATGVDAGGGIGGATVGVSAEDFQYVGVGGLINF
ncbi:MAG: porin [Hyphomicrobium sp.]|nr:MAG: porin [Hyphomicrobium sp.]